MNNSIRFRLIPQYIYGIGGWTGVIDRSVMWAQWHQAWVYGSDVTKSMPHAMPTPFQASRSHLSLPPQISSPAGQVGTEVINANEEMDLFEDFEQLDL